MPLQELVQLMREDQTEMTKFQEKNYIKNRVDKVQGLVFT